MQVGPEFGAGQSGISAGVLRMLILWERGRGREEEEEKKSKERARQGEKESREQKKR